MRMIGYSLTAGELVRGEKTETRRLGWCGNGRRLPPTPGELLRAVYKTMGLRRGEGHEDLGIVRAHEWRREPLDAITLAGVRAEGFPHLSPAEFVAAFCRAQKCLPSTPVSVIVFELVVVDIAAYAKYSPMRVHPSFAKAAAQVPLPL